MSCGGIPYIIDFGAIAGAIREARAGRVVIQMPDGLKQYSLAILKCLREAVGEGVELYIHADHNYGSCDLQYGQLWASIKPDVIVHIGHTPYPRELAGPQVEPGSSLGIKVIYAQALSTRRVSREALMDAARLLKRRGAFNVGLATTSQHVHIVKTVREALEEEGLRVAMPKGSPPFFLDAQVIGCDYRLARSTRAEAFLYVGGGVFHPLGLYLATLKPVIKVDPYEDRAVDLTPMGLKLYKSRLYRVSEAMEADRWGVIVGIKTGQYRPWLLARLVEALAREGKDYVLIASENLSKEILVSIDNDWYEAFVVTSCPRLPTDDYWDYEKPVLTPGEAFMALNRVLEPYRFPW